MRSRTFPYARSRSRSKFTKVRSKKINSFESESSLHVFKSLKLVRSLWMYLTREVFLGRVRSRAVFVNELQTSVLDFNQVHGKRGRQISLTFLLNQYTQQKNTQISSNNNKRRYFHITAPEAERQCKAISRIESSILAICRWHTRGGLLTGGPSSSCEMIILRNDSHGRIIKVCMGIFTTALRNEKILQILN